MNSDFDRFVLISRRKKILKDELAEIDREIAGMHESLIEDMADLGISNFKTERGETLYVHERVSAIPKVTREEASGALRLAGHGDLVSLNFSSISVSSLLKELDESNEIPACIHDAFHVKKIHTVRVRGLKTDIRG